ncbi:alpha/beta hydrolase [Phanerochaete sordida]|uniref:Palmitoyl-protein thioesterase 1 n=1 Tax=Phanerochaete sordida TaxID=48140 RepID=A0A9P3GEG8_9APHY|nr:alpha/beta hydrolase [Phanerochaete sordida]
MGDSYNSPGMLEVIEEIKNMHPGIFVHSVHLADETDDDRKAAYFGNLNDQVALVAEQLSNITELRHGFDAIGFSQAGQFFRAYVERYNSPPVNNLITFGSQHMGVSDIPTCKPFDVTCQLARRAALGSVYSTWVQANIVQAQYFRDPDRLPLYLERNHFLPDINAEHDGAPNKTYRAHLEALHKLVLVLFTEDTMVVPKESSWFGSYAPAEDSAEKTVIPMRLQPLYTKNRIGLRTLDERGDLELVTCEGGHMRLAAECWEPIIEKYVGGVLENSHAPEAVLRIQ